MWILYILSTALFLVPMLVILLYAAALYVFIAAPLRLVSKLVEHESQRRLIDSRGIQRYRGYGWKVGIYARNIALSIPDQGIASFLGQSPDVSLSESLGLAARVHETGDGNTSKFVLAFGKFVDWLFWNPLWKIEQDHIRQSLDPGEKFYNTLTHWHFTDSDTYARDVTKYIKKEA